MRKDPHADEVDRLARQLEHEHPIRLQMLAVVTLAGLAGFLVSFVLLHLGLTVMVVRYAIATLAGYGVFVVCVRVWLLGRETASSLQSDDGHTSSGLHLNLDGLGRIGGKANSARKVAAARANGKKGGRPPKIGASE